MVPLLLFLISLIYGIPIQTIYTIIIVAPLLKTNLNTPSYNKLITHFGVTTTVGLFLSFLLVRLPTVISTDNPSFRDVFEKFSTPHWFLDVLFLVREHAFAMIPVNGIWLFLYRMMTMLCPSTYEKIFNFASLTICLPTIAIPFLTTYPLWLSLNNFHYIRSPYGYYVPYFTEKARSSLYSLCILQIVCMQIVGFIVLTIVTIFHIKGKLRSNKILILRGISTYVMASIPVWFETFMIHKDRAKEDNEILFLLKPLVQDLGYHIQPVLLLIFNRQIRVIILQVIRLERPSLTKLNTISPHPNNTIGKDTRHSIAPIEDKEKRKKENDSTEKVTINITAPSERQSIDEEGEPIS